MAWPNSPLTAYVANSVPAIKAADLNAMQAQEVAVSTGTISLAAVVVDGTGGATVTGRAGTAKVSASDSTSGASFPMPVVAAGEISKGSVAIAWATVNGTTLLTGGFNVHAAPTHPGTGHYGCTFSCVPAHYAFVVTALYNGVASASWYNSSVAGGFLSVEVFTSINGSLADCEFSIVVFGE